MASTERNLRIVSPAPASPAPLIKGRLSSSMGGRTADPAAVEEAAEQWSDEILKCRIDGHRWDDSRATKNDRYKFVRIVQVCPRCESERVTEQSFHGEVYSRYIDYSEGYLLVGLGRITGEGRNMLRMTSVERLFQVQTLRGNAAKKELPHSRHAREALGLEEAG